MSFSRFFFNIFIGQKWKSLFQGHNLIENLAVLTVFLQNKFIMDFFSHNKTLTNTTCVQVTKSNMIHETGMVREKGRVSAEEKSIINVEL